MYTRILVERFHRVTKGVVDDEQGSFRSVMKCVNQIFTLN